MGPNRSNIGYQRVPVAPTHNQGSIEIVERYATRRCHTGNDIDSTTISSPSSLRTMMILKGEGMLGSYPNPLT
jgi:hypothetical protein